MRIYLLLLIACATVASAQTLPVKRVVLYKNGVGYFEHLGSVRGNDSVAVGFTSNQLNDVLKSLTVLDLDGGRIMGVSYGNAAPVERQLADMQLPTGGKVSVGALLGSFRGSKVELRNAGAVLSGRVLGVESRESIVNGRTIQTETAALLTDSGELRSADLSPAVAVRLLEPGLPAKLGRYLDVVASSRAAGERRMNISAAGAGERRLFVSYISEVPVWKSTYRIVLDGKDHGKATVQAWAIIDNTVGEDWSNVELSLVAGAPQSFIQNLSQPYYTRRPVVALPQYASATPQTHEGTLATGGGRVAGTVKDPSGAAIPSALVKATVNGAVLQQTFTDSSGRFAFDNLSVDNPVLFVEAPGFVRTQAVVDSSQAGEQQITLNVGSTSQSVEVTAAAPIVGTGRVPKQLNRIDGSLDGVGGAAYAPPPPPAATGQELGDLFEYKFDAPITVLKNRSALVPIAQASLDAEKVSLFNASISSARPQRALWFTNTSKLTLDGGSVSVSEGNAFAGEGLLDPIRPGEKRLVSYATDLALNISTKASAEPQRIVRASLSRGVLSQASEVRETKLYTVRNTDSQGRRVIVEHPLRSGYQLRGDVKPVETTNNFRRFSLTVPASSTATLAVEEARETSTRFALTDVNPDQLELFIRQSSSDSNLRAALEKIAAQKKVIAGLEHEKGVRDAETQKIVEDQSRLRENIKALRGAPEEKSLLQRYTAQLNQQENRLPQLEKESAALDAQIAAEQFKLNDAVESLSVDTHF